MVLEKEIGCASLDEVNRLFLTKGACHKNKRNVRGVLFCHIQPVIAIKTIQIVVGNDDVRRLLLQSVSQIGKISHVDHIDLKAIPFELVGG